jgi:hypothetical protein
MSLVERGPNDARTWNDLPTLRAIIMETLAKEPSQYWVKGPVTVKCGSSSDTVYSNRRWHQRVNVRFRMHAYAAFSTVEDGTFDLVCTGSAPYRVT